MVGCDGAHSWVRNQLGFTLRGESTDYIWGVLDIIPFTDFPDIRSRCAIHSANNGSVMIIPRENKLVRLYIQLTTAGQGDGGKADRSKISPEVILASAQRIMAPYKLTYNYCDWWTAYQIGQRVGDSFSLDERVFLAGDAVHTHSPKAGQGMNVSLQDTYNLGWKLASVINGTADISLLKTHESERRKVAQDLIEFDHRFSRLFSGRPARDIMDEEGVSMEVFKETFTKGNMFAAGLSVDYGASIIVAKEDPISATTTTRPQPKPSLATNIKLGMRIPSFKILNQSDGRPHHLQELLPSNGRWRILLFAGDLSTPSSQTRLQTLGSQLAAPSSFLHRYTPFTAPIDSVIEILTIHSGPRTAVELLDFHAVFHPWSEKTGWDYWKVFVDDASYHEGHGRAYENYGVDAEVGCALVVRPDQYVGWIGEVADYAGLEAFFGGFMLEQREVDGEVATGGVSVGVA